MRLIIASNIFNFNISISNARLNSSRNLHLHPIKVIISNLSKSINLEVGFELRCFQLLSIPNYSYSAMPLARQLIHQRLVHSDPLVQGANLLNTQRLW